MHDQIRNSGAAAKPDTTASGDNDQTSQKEPDVKTWSLSPGLHSQGLSDPLGNLLPSPFNPNTWDPFKEMDEMHKRMERLFDEAFGKFHSSPRFGGLAQGFSFNPKTDMSEDENQYIIRMDVPGTERAKINAKVEGGTLTIDGVRDEQVEHKLPGKALSRERRLGQFQRSIPLPGPVRADDMKVTYESGVLTITIPKDPSPPKNSPLSPQ